MGADLHFISLWEMSKISFLEGQGETGCLVAQPLSCTWRQLEAGLYWPDFLFPLS